jgi:hypothetical protein
MGDTPLVRHYMPIELSNEQRLQAAELLDKLKEEGAAAKNMNLGQFMSRCFFRGLNEYRKDISRIDT